MGCKHEGGTDTCKLSRNGSCLFRRRGVGRDYWNRVVLPSSRLKGTEQGRSTAAAELFVRADLSARGFEVTVPVSPTAIHDLHVELPSVGWKGVQVKAGTLNQNTNNISIKRHRLKSPIIAVVHIPTKRIDYERGTEDLPQELVE